MSKMYGKRRVVLSNPSIRGNAIVAVCGCDEESANYPGTGKHAGNYSPMGRWYRDNDGLFYVDLMSEQQKYRSVRFDELAHKHRGGFRTKAELRDFVMRIANLKWDLYLLAREGKPVDHLAATLNELLGGNYVAPQYKVYTPNESIS